MIMIIIDFLNNLISDKYFKVPFLIINVMWANNTNKNHKCIIILLNQNFVFPLNYP